jgi:hypothetical protein
VGESGLPLQDSHFTHLGNWRGGLHQITSQPQPAPAPRAVSRPQGCGLSCCHDPPGATESLRAPVGPALEISSFSYFVTVCQ